MTGENDFDYAGTLGDLLKTGAAAYQANQAAKNKPAKTAPVSAPAPQPTWLKPALIGGGVLAVLAVLFLAFRGKG